jgi:hypothetical protein
MIPAIDLLEHYAEYPKSIPSYIEREQRNEGTVTSCSTGIFAFTTMGYPLLTLKVDDKNIPLNNPISIDVHVEGEWYFASNEKIALEGTGESFSEAVEDFKNNVLFLWKHYKKSTVDELTPDAVAEKEYYEGLLQIG